MEKETMKIRAIDEDGNAVEAQGTSTDTEKRYHIVITDLAEDKVTFDEKVELFSLVHASEDGMHSQTIGRSNLKTISAMRACLV